MKKKTRRDVAGKTNKDVAEKTVRKKQLNLEQSGNVSVRPLVAVLQGNVGAQPQKPVVDAVGVSASELLQRQAAVLVSASARPLPRGRVKTQLLGEERFQRLRGRVVRLVL